MIKHIKENKDLCKHYEKIIQKILSPFSSLCVILDETPMTNKEDFIYEKESDYNQIQKGE